MMRRENDAAASVGINAMVVFIAIILASSVIGALLVGVADTVFTRPKADAQRSTSTFNGITNVLVLEITALAATDEIHIVFDLPYIEQALPEEDLSWVLMCLPTGETRIQFDEGDFQPATTLDGNGFTSLPLVEFEVGEVYHMIIMLDICDLQDVSEATLILMIDEGRTREITLRIGPNPSVGQDLF